MGNHVIIVGGGLAGLAASIYLARSGKTVTIFEKRRYLGGRAITHLRHGFRFNLGPHAVYRNGRAAQVYRELGVPIRGGSPKSRGVALLGGERHKLPGGPWSLLTSSLLTFKAKVEFAKLMLRIRGMKDTSAFASMTAREWLDANVTDLRLRALLESLMRVATYSDHADQQSAAVALKQLHMVVRGGVIYVDEGWQKLVDAMHSHAVAAGVNFVTSSRIVGVHHENGQVRSVELGGLELEDRNDTLSVALPDVSPEAVEGARLPADNVILTVDPTTARELIGVADWPPMMPVTATCLDVALRSLPQPKNTFALGIDKPLYFSVHSAAAQLTPKGGALIHVAKYRKKKAAISDDELESDRVRRTEDVAADERELEGLLDAMQPGWRDLLVHRRFLPSMTVSNALVTPSMKRPSPQTSIRGLYLAGDWVGDEGILSDAALSSARAAAQMILKG